MNQAINLIDEIIDTLDIIYIDSSEDGEIRRTYNAMRGMLLEAKKRISALPSDTQWIDTLQRYKPNEFPSENEVYTMEEFYNRDNSLMLKSIVGEYIRYDDLKKLLLQ